MSVANSYTKVLRTFCAIDNTELGDIG